MGYTRSIFQSSTDFSFYRTVVENKPFPTLRYLGFVCFMISLFSFAQIGARYSAAADEHLKNIGQRLEGIEIRDGSVQETEAFRTQTFVLGPVLFQIAPEDNPDEELPENISTQITLTKNSLTIKDNSATRILPLSPIGHFLITPRTVGKIRIYAAAVFFLFFVTFSTVITFAVKLIKAFIVSDLIYLLLVKKKIPDLPVSSRLNIGVYAIVPSVVIEIFASTNSGLIPYIPYICMAMFCAFVIGAYKSIQPEEQEENDDLEFLL